jgi:hypothetical protein
MERFLRGRREWLVVAAATALVAAFAFPPVGLADLPGGCDFAPTGSTPSCLGPLTPSTFAGGDGNLLAVPATFGSTDWENVSGLVEGIDLPSGSGDNSFGQGTKEDNPDVTVVSGSIPPNKSDLVRFYEASEFISANSHNYLYLAWERSNVLGNANMDFEINAATQSGLGSPGAHTIIRSAGDLLVTFDFNNGGGRPVIGLDRWLLSTTNPTVPGFSTNVCFASNTFPCWGDNKVLDGTDSIAAVNNLDSVTDPIAPSAGRSEPALTFGETAIDLTKAGVFSVGTCSALGSTFLKSRASSSFTAEVKDFVAPVPVNISNCGEVTIIKHTDPPAISKDFNFTSNVTGTIKASNPATACPSSYMLNDGSASTNTMDCVNVPAGSGYVVTEGAEPTGFAFESLSCTSTGGSSGSQNATNQLEADITVAPGGTTTCTYVNKQQLGAIKITKTSSKAALTPLAGAKFSINDPGGTALPGSPFMTDNNGVVCVDGLTALGNYTVQEVSPPTGYSTDDTTAHTVNVTGSNAKCTDTTFNGQTLAFTDTPLTNLTITVNSQVSGGTKSSITCVIQGTTTDIGNSPQPSSGLGDPETVTATGLAPGDYVCTVHVDP